MDHTLSSRQLHNRLDQLEAELMREKLLLNAVFEQNLSPMVLVSLPEGIIQMVSPALMDFWGVHKEASFTGKRLADINPSWQDIDLEGKPVPQNELPLSKAMLGKTTKSQIFGVIRQDGSRRWGSVTATPIYNQTGEIIAAFAAFADITELKRLEEALRESEDRYRFLTDNAHDVIWMMGFDGRLTYVSPSVEAMRGFTPEEVLKQTLDELFTPEAAVIVRSALENTGALATLGQEVNFRRFELQQLRKDGSTVWTEVTTSGLYGSDGKLTGFWGISRDISERKEIEGKLIETLIELEGFNKAMVGREQRMIELKREVNYLLVKIGKDTKYSIPSEQ